jgi:prepilin-type N-terminal cleavage/methylation domain-containing protein
MTATTTATAPELSRRAARSQRRSGRCVDPRRVAGCSLVELIAVMVIIGILAATAAPRFFATNSFAAAGYAAERQAGLRHAQSLAMASGCVTRVVVERASDRLQRWMHC